MKKVFLLAVITTFYFVQAMANVSLPKVFSDYMVLQRDQSIKVWGWASPGENVTVSIDKQSKKTVTGKNGKWLISLDALKAGGPFQFTVKGRNTIILNNVLIGEVWFCSGQSNMEMPIAGWGKINNYEQEIADAKYPQIRQFNVEKNTSAYALDSADGKWMLCDPAHAGEFIATGYFFARELYKKLNVPIGIINCSWGGSMIETWISREAFENDNEFQSMIRNTPAEKFGSDRKNRHDVVQREIQKLQDHLPTAAEAQTWKNADFDDNRWPDMQLPGFWDKQNPGMSELDGAVWFRKKIEVDESYTGRPGIVTIGQSDDAGEVFVNGFKLEGIKNADGETTRYSIGPGILRKGENVISLRVRDYGGSGGIVDGTDMNLNIDNKMLDIKGSWKYQVESVFESSNNPNSFPTLLYNAMVHPLIPYGIKGALWYQGETNAGRAYQYRKAFPLMITDWRNRWKLGDFPFYFVQLASFNADKGNSEKGSSWAELREAQTKTLSLKNTGMAVTSDIGDAIDIHPKNKQDVGKRLAALALKNTYNIQVASDGPVYSSMKKDGNKIVLSFSNIEGGLAAKNKYGYLQGFEIAGADKKFHWAKAFIDGDKVIVSAEEVKDPVAVHYGWSDNTEEVNLFNKAGFPASPFRTDDWSGVTDSVQFSVPK